MNIELTDQGYLLISAAIAYEYFPEDVLVILSKPPELWLLPLRGASAGGLMLKQRNRQGDRSVLIREQLPPDTSPDLYPAFWDQANGALRVALKGGTPRGERD